MEFHTKSKLHHFTLGEYLQIAAVNVWAQCKVPVLIKPKLSWELLPVRNFLKIVTAEAGGDGQDNYFFKQNADLKPLSPRDF